jgi:hypothetical protein
MATGHNGHAAVGREGLAQKRALCLGQVTQLVLLLRGSGGRLICTRRCGCCSWRSRWLTADVKDIVGAFQMRERRFRCPYNVFEPVMARTLSFIAHRGASD